MDDPLLWREQNRAVIARCGIFDLIRAERVAGDGRPASFYVLEAPGWVNVVPVLPGGRFLMVRQYRQGLERTTVEFPAGLVEEGEEPVRAAARELEEETGRRAVSLTPIGRVAANPAFMNNWCSTFCAEGLVPSGRARPDELERLEIVEVDQAELAEKIGTGEYVNSMTVVAWNWYLRYRGEGRPLGRVAPRQGGRHRT
jgi:8-oxo-dGTP pyrophosphatase MutT (NUDIX family)